MRGFAGRKDLTWLFLFVPAFLFVTPALMGQQSKLVPVIYATDLFHPPGDPDDTVDLATLYSVPELDIRAIILDQGLQQRREPGEIPVKQMTVLTGRQAPYATGLLNPLRYPQDAALNQFGTAQSGVNLILRTLRESDQRVVIITVGSVRDVAAAFNREPALFEQKVDRIYVNAGNSGVGDFQWNPFLDPQAYLRLMQSNLPIYWAPSFDGRGSPELFIARTVGGWTSSDQLEVSAARDLRCASASSAELFPIRARGKDFLARRPNRLLEKDSPRVRAQTESVEIVPEHVEHRDLPPCS